MCFFPATQKYVSLENRWLCFFSGMRNIFILPCTHAKQTCIVYQYIFYVNLHCKSFELFSIRAVLLLRGMKKCGSSLVYILK